MYLNDLFADIICEVLLANGIETRVPFGETWPGVIIAVVSAKRDARTMTWLCDEIRVTTMQRAGETGYRVDYNEINGRGCYILNHPVRAPRTANASSTTVQPIQQLRAPRPVYDVRAGPYPPLLAAVNADSAARLEEMKRLKAHNLNGRGRAT
jgi:hypothetical protein